MHKILKRQLQRVYGDTVPQSPNFQKLLGIISDTYEARDSEYELVERSLDISSKELTEVNEKLREEKAAIEQIVADRTKELSQERSKLEKVAQNMQTGAILFDQNGEVVFVNNTARDLIDFFDTTYANVLSKLYQTFASYQISDFVNRCLEGEESELKDIDIENSSFEMKFQVLENSNGYLIWIKDVTGEKLLERSKSELLAIASHQLRSPLTVVKGNTEMLLDKSFGPLSKEQMEIVQQIEQSNENMIKLISQMIDITQISQQAVHFDMSDVSVEKVLQQVVDDLKQYANKYKVTVSCSINTDSGATVLADSTRLYQIFQNLIENAIKYSNAETGDGVVYISSELRDNKIIVKIKDTGIGIPENEQDNLFEQFYRASNAAKFSPDGSGLGLYIVKSMVEFVNGTVEFTSAENQGTTFIISFPINT